MSSASISLPSSPDSARHVLALHDDPLDLDPRLAASEARFQRLVESSLVGLVIGEPDGTLVFVNDAVLDMLGYTRAQIDPAQGGTPLRWDRLTPPEHLPADHRAIAQLIAGGHAEPYEKEYFHRDGRRIPVQIGATRLGEHPVTGVPQVAAYVLDLRPLRETQAALREADRRKDEFIAMLAHELRNPLAPIVNAARVLEHEPALTGSGRHSLVMIDRQLKQLKRLVDDLLEVSRITRGTLVLQPEETSLGTLVLAAVDAALPAAQARGQVLEAHLPPQPVRRVVDPVRMVQVLGNLLGNAVKYTPEGGHIRIVLHADARIEVIDDGMGIECARLQEVFELFVQTQPGVGAHQGGLGIGLHMVRRLVELHGGRVWAESEGPGTGTRVVVELPPHPG